MDKYKLIIYRVFLLIIASVLSWYFMVYFIMIIGYQIATFNKGYSNNPAEQIWNEKLIERKAQINSYAFPRLALLTPFTFIAWFLLIKSIIRNNKMNNSKK